MRICHCFKPVCFKTLHRAWMPRDAWFALRAAPEYYDAFETLAIRDSHELWPGGLSL